MPPNTAEVALLAAVIGIALAPRAIAAPTICPQYLTRYCVVTPEGERKTVETNPCFAAQQHMRVVHRGACRAGDASHGSSAGDPGFAGLRSFDQIDRPLGVRSVPCVER